MFQSKDIEAYKSIKAPQQLKNRIRMSVEQQKRNVIRQSVALVSAATCFVLVFLAGGFLPGKGTVISVNDVMISHQAVELENVAGDGVVMASRARSMAPQIQIPLEMHVKEEAHMSVSQGMLQKEVETGSESMNTTELDITDSQVVYWTVTGDFSSPAICTIMEGRKEYVYLIEFNEEESVFTIKQTK